MSSRNRRSIEEANASHRIPFPETEFDNVIFSAKEELFHTFPEIRSANKEISQSSQVDNDHRHNYPSTTYEDRIQVLEATIEELRYQRTDLIQSNTALRSVVEMAGTGAINAAEWYRKALKFETLYQDEILARERAETNLSCYKIECEEKLARALEVENSLRDELKASGHNLEEGVGIMKSLEEELLHAQEHAYIHWEKEIAEYKKTVQRLEHKIEKILQELHTVKTESVNIKSTNRDLLQEVAKFDLSLNDRQIKISELEYELEKKEAKCESLMKDIAMAREEYSNLLVKANNCEAREKFLLDEKEDLMKSSMILTEKIINFENQIREKELEYHNSLSQLEADYLRDIDERCAEIINLQDEVSRYKNEISLITMRYKLELEAYKKEHSTEKLVKAYADKEAETKQIAAALEDLRCHNFELEERNKALAMQKDKDAESWMNLEQKFRDDLYSLREQLSSLLDDNKNLERECKALEITVHRLQGLKQAVKINGNGQSPNLPEKGSPKANRYGSQWLV